MQRFWFETMNEKPIHVENETKKKQNEIIEILIGALDTIYTHLYDVCVCTTFVWFRA